MPAFQLPKLRSLTQAQQDSFDGDGFLIIENVLAQAQVEALRARFPLLFAGKFDTGIYPDEWHWREGMSLPEATRNIGNGWKSDLTIASLALSQDIGQAALHLTNWTGARLGQDTIWWKPPGTKAVTLHQDASFLDFLDPSQMLTCWVALDDTKRNAGTLEYVKGSHKWPLTEAPETFHGADDYRAPMHQAAQAANITEPEIIQIEVPAGSCVFHIGETWHGSGPNQSGTHMRRSIGIHMLPSTAKFTGTEGGYIYRRYQRTGDPALDESFFPILADEKGCRTAWLDQYCETGQRVAQTQAA